MKKLFALATVLAGLCSAVQAMPPHKQKPMKQKPIEKTRRHLHQESMHRVQKDAKMRAKDK